MHTTVLLVVFHCLISSSFLRTATAVPVETSQMMMEKRSAAPDRINDDYPDYQLGVRYDEYPTIVPKKRTALLVNRLMVALKDALEEEDRERNSKTLGVFGSNGNLYSDDVRTDNPDADDNVAAGSSSQSVAGPSTECMDTYPEQENKRSIEVQTDMTMEDMTRFLSDMNFCNEKKYSLQEKLKIVELSEASFMGNDTKALYFTGFPKSEMMFRIFKEISNFLSHKTTLSEFQQFLLTLMKLRLNLPFKYLSYRFGISPATASDIVYKCIDILYERYIDFVFWPARETIQKNMPACFKENFGNRVTAIIDCFENFTETPSGLVTSAQYWSNYKHHQTIKFLIGITPHGTISHISDAWGGRTSDKFLTENCEFLNKILPGDMILVDRGFLIKESVETLGAHLEIPAFTKGKNQLHPAQLESTRNIANVRIHVERVIGLLRKKYKICQGPIPISMLCISRDELSDLDKILVIFSAFVNMCPSVVPINKF